MQNVFSCFIYFSNFFFSPPLLDVSAMPRGTPLYGQPSWWGDDEVDEQRVFKSNGKPEEKSHEAGTSGKSTSMAMILNSSWSNIFQTKVSLL